MLPSVLYTSGRSSNLSYVPSITWSSLRRYTFCLGGRGSTRYATVRVPWPRLLIRPAIPSRSALYSQMRPIRKARNAGAS